jgi:Fic family protein
VAGSITNEQILIDTLAIQEAKESSEIENIVTTRDELYQSSVNDNNFASPAAKEVHAYAEALKLGFAQLKTQGGISLRLILTVQETIERNNAGIRKVPGTVLKNDLTGEVVYTPPQSHEEIKTLMHQLEHFINGSTAEDMDPLLRMALAHFQFECIHPFYDGNGRTGRILNILMLIQDGLLHLPVLYLSRYIILNRAMYYKLLRDTHVSGNFEPWLLYMLDAVETTAKENIQTITAIKALMLRFKKEIRDAGPRMYSQDLINSLFRHPYSKIGFIEKDLRVSRLTASRYLDKIKGLGLLHKRKIGRVNYYINQLLLDKIMRHP